MSFTVNEVRNTPSTRNVIESVVIGVVLTAASYILAAIEHWPVSQGWWLLVELLAVFTQYSCTYLCYRERRIQYPIGFVSTAAFFFLFWHFGLKGSAVLNAWLTFQLLYGWFRWRSDKDTRPVTWVKLKWWPAYIVGTAAFYFVGYTLDKHFGGQQAWTDIVIFTGSILAQFLLDNKKMENWIAWFTIDVFAVYEYYHQHLYLTGFQFIFLTAGTLYGAYLWWKSWREDRATPRLRIKPGEDAKVRFIGEPTEMKFVHTFETPEQSLKRLGAPQTYYGELPT